MPTYGQITVHRSQVTKSPKYQIYYTYYGSYGVSFMVHVAFPFRWWWSYLSSVTFTGKVEREIKFGEVMSHDPRPPPISTPTAVPICQRMRRDKTRDGPTQSIHIGPTDHPIGISDQIWSSRCTERKIVVTANWKNAYFRRFSRKETPFPFV